MPMSDQMRRHSYRRLAALTGNAGVDRERDERAADTPTRKIELDEDLG